MQGNESSADDEGELQAIFLMYALAMHDAQLLELAIASVNTLWGDDMRSIAIPGDERLADVEAQGQRTLGMLVQRFRTRVRGNTLLPLMESALQMRNRLAHHFFRDRFGRTDDPAVRQEMLAELTEARAVFQRLYDIMNGSIVRWLDETRNMGETE